MFTVNTSTPSQKAPPKAEDMLVLLVQGCCCQRCSLWDADDWSTMSGSSPGACGTLPLCFHLKWAWETLITWQKFHRLSSSPESHHSSTCERLSPSGLVSSAFLWWKRKKKPKPTYKVTTTRDNIPAPQRELPCVQTGLQTLFMAAEGLPWISAIPFANSWQRSFHNGSQLIIQRGLMSKEAYYSHAFKLTLVCLPPAACPGKVTASSHDWLAVYENCRYYNPSLTGKWKSSFCRDGANKNMLCTYILSMP